jgi:hypothetical protein
MTVLVETLTLPTAATGANVATALPGAGDVVTASRLTKSGIILNRADQTNADTLPENVAIAITMTVDDNVTVFLSRR